MRSPFAPSLPLTPPSVIYCRHVNVYICACARVCVSRLLCVRRTYKYANTDRHELLYYYYYYYTRATRHQCDEATLVCEPDTLKVKKQSLNNGLWQRTIQWGRGGLDARRLTVDPVVDADQTGMTEQTREIQTDTSESRIQIKS